MKIYTPKHDIQEADFIKNNDIPLAYIDTKDTTYEANVRLFDGFAADRKTLVRAYQKLSSNRTILFDENSKPVKKTSYRRVGNELLYEPTGAKEFTPETFSCTATIQKQIEYSPTDEYDIIVGAIEKDDGFSLCSKLISVFGDAYKKDVCPHNIKVNSGSMIKESLISAAGNSSDFIFVETEDGKNFSGLDIKTVLNKHINVWISSSQWAGEKKKDLPTTLKEEGRLNSFYVNTPRKKISKYIFDENYKLDILKDKEYKYSYPYEDIMLIEKENTGFIVVTPNEFLENCRENIKVIYDIMMHIYFRAYKKSRPAVSWITDEVVDYTAFSYMPLKLHHKQISLDNMLIQNGYDIRDKYRLIRIETTNPVVSFVGMTSDKTLLFRKTKKTDPVKDAGITSFLTTKNTVVLYEQEKIYLLSCRANIRGKSVNGKNYIIVSPIRDSDRAIYSEEEQELEVPDVKFIYYVCTRRGNAYTKNEFKLVEQSAYSMVEHGYRIAEVRFHPRYDTKMIDIRTPGGGLPSQEEDNFNLMDIGNIYGRPYRIGSTLIIRLPKKLEAHKNKIRKAVNQHISAGEYPVLIFE